MDVFFKGQLTYSNPKYLTVSLSYTAHTGDSYTALKSGGFDAEKAVFIPQIQAGEHARFRPYYRFDITLNKLFPLGKKGVIVYCTLANLLNRKNEKTPYYTADYAQVNFQYFQRRTVYVGLQFKF